MKTLHHFFIFFLISTFISGCGSSPSSVAPEGTITFKVNGVNKTFKQYYQGVTNISTEKQSVIVSSIRIEELPFLFNFP